MRKILFTFMLLLVTALAVNAQNLESKQLVVKNSDNQEIPFYAE